MTPEEKSAEASRLHEWATATTWHGVADAYSAPSRLIQIVWIVLLLLSTILFLQQGIVQIQRFNDAGNWGTAVWDEALNTGYLPDMTNEDFNPYDNQQLSPEQLEKLENETEIHKANLIFPTLVICDQKLISAKRVKELNFLEDETTIIIEVMQTFFINDLFGQQRNTARNGDFSEEPNHVEIYAHKAHENFTKIVAGTQYQNWTQKDWLDNVTPRCEDIFLLGGFNFKSGGRYFDSVCEYIKKKYVPNMGVCFEIRPPLEMFKWFQMMQSGMDTGLTLYMETNYNDYPTTVASPLPGSALLAFVAFHASASTWREIPIALAGGTTNYIPFTRRSITIEKPDSNPFRNLLAFQNPELPCSDEVVLEHINAFYTFETCSADCFYKMVYEVCGCLPAVDSNLPKCSPTRWLQCIVDVGKGRNENIMNVANCTRKCGDNCLDALPLPRHTWMKSPIGIQAAQVSNWLNQRLRRNMSAEYITNNIVKVNLFNENVRVNVVQRQQQMTIETLISNIGGTLGVYAGMSIITLCQALAYMMHSLYDIGRGRWIRRYIKSKGHYEI